MDYRNEVELIKEELFEIRKTIHRHPERGNQEFQTAALIEKKLQEWGIETVRLLDTAVVGILKGDLPGKTVALRADIDALPVQENTGVDFASEVPGVMHACGHDVHTTAALGAAKLLSMHRDRLKGEVRFFFQPDEEYNGGAKRMINAGCMGDTEAVFGSHVDPYLPEGTVGVRYGKFYAASSVIIINVNGKQAHGATPEKGINALHAAAELVCELQSLPKKVAEEKCVLTIGLFNSGTACNIVSAKTEIQGVLRVLGQKDKKAMEEAILKAAKSIDEKFGTVTEVDLSGGYTGIENTDPETAFAEHVIKEVLGEEHTVRIEEPKMITEDFGCFVDASKGSFYHIGAGCESPLHSNTFLPTEKALLTAAAVHASVLESYLNQ